MADEAFKEELENIKENSRYVKRPVRRELPISYYLYPLKSISYRKGHVHHLQERSIFQKKKKKNVSLMFKENLKN